MILLLALILSIFRHMLQNTNVIPLFCVAINLKSPNRTVLKFHSLSSLQRHTFLLAHLQCHTFLLAQPVLTEFRRAMTNLMFRLLTVQQHNRRSIRITTDAVKNKIYSIQVYTRRHTKSIPKAFLLMLHISTQQSQFHTNCLCVFFYSCFQHDYDLLG
jgi:hypothetical protein